MDWVVCVGVVLQTYEVYDCTTLTETDDPIQMVPSLEVVPVDSVYDIVGVGNAFTVTVKVAVAVHPLAAVAVTV